MEAERAEQIADLEEQGWVIDDECRVKQEEDSISMRMGGRTYMKSPTGVMHEVGYGEVKTC